MFATSIAMTNAELLGHLKKNPFVLAPMAGITDSPFRRFMREMGAGIVISELVSAQGLKYNSQKTKDLMRFDERERPVGIQLFGECGDVIGEAAKYVQDQGADFVDLNFGCPVNKVVKKGAGAAATRDLISFRDLLRKVRSAITVPLTIKIRTGWDEGSRNALDVVRIAYDEGVTWVAIHGRTRTQGYSGLSDWDFIGRVKADSPLPIIGNGDVLNGAQARARLLESGCDGVMIGRGCLKDPKIFQAANGLDVSDEPMVNLVSRLGNYLLDGAVGNYPKIQLRKFAMWYSYGLPEASSFRRELFSEQDVDRLKTLIESYFLRVQNCIKVIPGQDNFLMGGHG
jgi:tRNA-dihydrouridine synthase B